MLKTTSTPKVTWTQEEDSRLVEIFLEQLQNGATIKQAAKFTSSEMGRIGRQRTPEACLFRWYGTLSKDYKELFDEAKAIGAGKTYVELENTSENVKLFISKPDNNTLLNKEATFDNQSSLLDEKQVSTSALPSNDEIEKVKRFIDSVATQADELRNLKNQITELQYKLSLTEGKLRESNRENETLQGDVEAYSKIFNRAREISLQEDLGKVESATFKMNKNGNLEKI